MDREGRAGRGRLRPGRWRRRRLSAGRSFPLGRSAAGVDKDHAAIEACQRVFGDARNVRLVLGEFLALDFKPESFDLVCFVASPHHMDLEPALAKAVGLLRPSG